MRKGIDVGLARERSTDLLLQDDLWKLSIGNFSGRANRTGRDTADQSGGSAIAQLGRTHLTGDQCAIKRSTGARVKTSDVIDPVFLV